MAETLIASLTVPIKAPYMTGSSYSRTLSASVGLSDPLSRIGYRPSDSPVVGSIASYEGIDCTGLESWEFVQQFESNVLAAPGHGWLPFETTPDLSAMITGSYSSQWVPMWLSNSDLWASAVTAGLETALEGLWVWDLPVWSVAGESDYRYSVLHSIDRINGQVVARYVYTDGTGGYLAEVDETHKLIGAFSFSIVRVHHGYFNEWTGSWSEPWTYGGRFRMGLGMGVTLHQDIESLGVVPGYGLSPVLVSRPVDERGLFYTGALGLSYNRDRSTDTYNPEGVLIVPGTSGILETELKYERWDTGTGHIKNRAYADGVLLGEHTATAMLFPQNTKEPLTFSYYENCLTTGKVYGDESWRIGEIEMTVRGSRAKRNWTNWYNWWSQNTSLLPNIGYVKWNDLTLAGYSCYKPHGDVGCTVYPFAYPRRMLTGGGYDNPHPTTYWLFPADYQLPKVDVDGYVYWVHELEWDLGNGLPFDIDTTGFTRAGRTIHALRDEGHRTKVAYVSDGALYFQRREDPLDSTTFSTPLQIGTSGSCSNPCLVVFADGSLGLWYMDGDTQVASYSNDDGRTWTAYGATMLGSNLRNLYVRQHEGITYGVGVRDSVLYFVWSNDQGATPTVIPGTTATERAIGACGAYAVPCLEWYPDGKVVAWTQDDSDAQIGYVNHDSGFLTWTVLT